MVLDVLPQGIREWVRLRRMEGERDYTPHFLTYMRAAHVQPHEPEQRRTLWKDLIQTVTKLTSRDSLRPAG